MNRHTLLQVAAFLLLCVFPAGFTSAAEPLHLALTVNGTPLQGDGPEKVVLAFGFDHEVVRPIDAATGQSTGRYTYKPIRIVKAIDQSTPLLMKALTTNSTIAGEFRFRRADPKDPKNVTTYYTVSITGGHVIGVRNWKTNTRDLSADRAGDLEEISFTFQTITWTYVQGGITHTDSWSANP
jgi:type VI secretion system secreted protein Hcp